MESGARRGLAGVLRDDFQFRGRAAALRPACGGAGFLPSQYQGVKFRSSGDPVLYLSNPADSRAGARRQFLDTLGEMNRMAAAEFGDPETKRRGVAQVRDGVSDAGLGRNWWTRRRSRLTRLNFMARMRGKARHLRGQLSAGAATGGARRAVHTALPSRLGSSREFAAGSAEALPGCGPRFGGADFGFGTARHAGRYFGGLGGEFGRTVYCQGSADGDRLRARSSRAVLHDVDGGRGDEARGSVSGRPDDYGYNITRIRFTCTICRRRFCIAWGSIICGSRISRKGASSG